VVALAYSLCAWFGRLLVVQPEFLASFWVPSGIALAALLLSPKRLWPGLLLGIFAANIVVNMATGTTFLVSAGFGIANCSEPLVAAFVLDRILGTPFHLNKLKDVVGLTFLAALAGNAATALMGAAVPHLAYGAPYWAVWRVWWIADALGIVLATPIILSWAAIDWSAVSGFLRRRGVEAAVLFATMTVLAQVVFGAQTASAFLLPFPYVTFPFLLWAAVRFGTPGASVASLILAVVAVWNTAIRHLGPFAASGGTISTQVLSTQAFLGVVALSALMLAVVIGERQQAEETLQKTNEGLEERIQERTKELARSNAELEQFAYVASHDLREPLRAIGGMAQLLEQSQKDHMDSRAREYVNHLLEGVGRMQMLIDDLLAFSRIGSKTDMVQVVQTGGVMESVVANLSVAIQESGAVVTHEKLPTLRCDPTQLTQVLQNLIGNAIKFRGEARPEIKVGAELKGGEWVFTVRDNGIGIGPEYFDRIFVIFQRLHTRRAYPGSGIGLAICKKIVTLHGGRIWVESSPGKGSTFFFTYPERVGVTS
jgi:signal transduction histidine kinase